MPLYRCPNGHQSTESDFCSDCGAKIQGIAELLLLAKNAIVPSSPDIPTLTLTQKSTTAVENCPACSTPHEVESGNFCEICGYNFVTKSCGELPIAISQPSLKEVQEVQEVQEVEEQIKPPVIAWQILVAVDPSLASPQSPAPPANQPVIIIDLDKPAYLIGRNSQARAVYPEIALDFDDAVSHRHALLSRQIDGTFTLRDIGSSNGTVFNRVELKPMMDVPLQDQDEFTLGHWTKITIQAVHQHE